MTPRIGSLFAGYGGLEMGVASILGGAPAWFSEFDDHPSRILAYHHPDVPNHGDITKIDWSAVEPVDVLTGGFPCQDVSHAGARAGLRDGTRTGLWSYMRDAIDRLRPRLVVAENVRGLLSADADSSVEPCPWCMGDPDTSRPMRALGAVLADLADLGYDAFWCGLRAADVGAPHGRFRVFIFALPADAQGDRWDQGRPEPAGVVGGPDVALGGSGLLPRTPTAQLAVNGGSQHPEKRKAGGHGPTLADEVEYLLPTPAVNDMGKAYTPEEWDAWTAKMKASHGNGNGHGNSLHVETLRIASVQRFGDYAPAIARWEAATRPAPAPTEPTGKGGAHRLSPAFVEWMMGLPAGWVTDPAIWASLKPSTARNAQLKALGNGVVPQQAAEATRRFLAFARTQEAAA